MKKMDQVNCTVLGTVGSCILKSIFTLHYNVQQVSLHVLIRIQDQDSFSYFGVGNYITDNLVCSPVEIGSPFLRKNIRMPWFYVKNPFS